MRTLIEPAPAVLARRWCRLERLAMVTLHRDQFAEPPGPSVSLALGERTSYRPAAWVLDTWERAALGTGYTTPAGWSPLSIVGGRLEPPGVDAGLALHATAAPRDQWAAVTLAALEGAGPVAAGVVVRGDYVVRAVRTGTTGVTEVRRLEGGVLGATLATTGTPWRAGEVLRVTAEWRKLTVYRGPIRVLELTDADLEGATLGLYAARTSGADVVALGAWSGGALRQEYLGAVLDLGDVQAVLGQPVSFDVTVSNLAPMGGKPSFSALLRHGVNTAGTYDVDRGTVRVLTALEGATAPLEIAEGLIDAPGDVGPDRVRLAVRGRDAFLTPRLTPGVVTYLPGPDAGGLTPLPADPCAPAAPPVVMIGAPPVEPPTEDTLEGAGPEAPDAGGGDGSGALLGAYIVRLMYRRGRADITPPEPPWITATEVLGPLPNAVVLEACPGAAKGDFFARGIPGIGDPVGATGLNSFYHYWRRFSSSSYWTRVVCLLYRGPDVPGLEMKAQTNCEAFPGGTYSTTKMQAFGTRFLDTVETPTALTTTAVVKLARYEAGAIRTVADLHALRIATPADASEWNTFLPLRIETLVSAVVEGTFTQPAGGLIHVGPLPTGATIPLTQLTGPSLLAVELEDVSWGGGTDNAIAVNLGALYDTAEESPSVF